MKRDAVWSVSELTRHLKGLIERDAHLADVWVRGEISNFTHHTSGHMYFTLKDEQSRLKVVMFASHNRYLKFLPQNGTKVILRGSISVYERDGAYQLYAREMQPDGLGSLHLAFEQLKEKLRAEGLFAPERKRPLPAFPKKVGVVTSPTGAAVRDIITTIRRRFPQAHIVLSPAAVQGEEAPASIVQAIARINMQMDVDVLIVGRGGGSIEELWAFNDEQVARAIAASRIPVISAVGHETDFTIADFVADVRAATPTAAAELAVPHYLEWLERVRQLEHRLHRSLRGLIAERKSRLERLAGSYGMRLPLRRVDEQRMRLDDLCVRLGQSVSQAVRRGREQADRLAERLHRLRLKGRLDQGREQARAARNRADLAIRRRLERAREQWLGAVARLDALSPLKVMQRGYALVYKDGQLAKSAAPFATGDPIVVRFQDGTIHACVTEIDREENGDGSQTGRRGGHAV